MVVAYNISTLECFKLDRELGRENIFDNIIPALARANETVDKNFRK